MKFHRLFVLETAYLNLLRFLLVATATIGLLSIIAAGAWWIVAQLSERTHTAAEFFEPPTWQAIRGSVLPVMAQPEISGQPDTSDDETIIEDAPSIVDIDPRIDLIANNLNAQFERNTGKESAFTDTYPKVLIEEWIAERSSIPSDSRS